jgi:hypothetical protein
MVTPQRADHGRRRYEPASALYPRLAQGPRSFLYAIDVGPCPDTISRHPYSIAAYPDATCGPYESRQDIIQGVVEDVCNSRPAEHADRQDDNIKCRILASKQEDDHNTMALAHGDLNKSNILVKNE